MLDEYQQLQTHWGNLSCLHYVYALDTKEKNAVKTLNHTINVCDEAANLARMMPVHQNEPLDVSQTSITKRNVSGWINDRPDHKTSVQAINDFKKVQKRLLKTQRRIELQAKIMKGLQKFLNKESDICENAKKVQVIFESQLQKIHASMYQQKGAAEPSNYYQEPGSSVNRHSFPNELLRFTSGASCDLEATEKKIKALNEFKSKVEAQLKNRGTKADPVEVAKLLQEMPDVMQMGPEAALKVEVEPECPKNESANRDASKKSPAQALDDAMTHLRALGEIGNNVTPGSSNESLHVIEMTDEDIDEEIDVEIKEKFRFAQHGWISWEESLTERQFNELADLILSAKEQLSDLEDQYKMREEVLEDVAASLDRDTEMFKSVVAAEQPAAETLEKQLMKLTGVEAPLDSDKLDTMLKLTENQVKDILKSNHSARANLLQVQDEIKQLLLKARTEMEAAASTEAVDDSTGETDGESAIPIKQRSRQLSEFIQQMVDFFEGEVNKLKSPL